MNKAWQYWVYSICTDIALVVCAWFWVVHGSAVAENVLVFSLWAATAAALFTGLVGLLTPSDRLPVCRRPLGFQHYNWLTNILLIAFLVAVGFVWLPACFLVAACVHDAFSSRQPKAA